ncbi:MAG TPA: hypothetical protein ENK08_12020 [Chloroflexi bacterium]|nr:hypothetical protein [Chloroflexota bacterium]
MGAKGKVWIAGLLLALFLLTLPATAFAAAQPDPPDRHRRAVRGEVTAVTPPTLVVQTTTGPVVVTTDENTRFRIPGVENPSLEDIQVGDHVVCILRWREQGTVAALVAVVNPDRQGERVGGQVLSVEGSDITIHTFGGETVVVHTDSETRFRIPGVEDPGPDDIEVGSLIGAVGERGEDGVFRARLVVVPRTAARRGRVTGEVMGIEGTTLVLQTKGGREVRLLTDEETVFHVPGVETPSLEDVHVGNRVTAEVVLREGVLYAAQVIVWPHQPARLRGKVTAIEGRSLLLETPYGQVRVLTDDSTMFRIPGVENPSLDDVRVGDHVGCGGEWKNEKTFHASVVVVQRDRPAAGQPGVVRGRALAVDGDRLTVGTARGPVTVVTGQGTTIHVPGVESPSLADIQTGDRVTARGQWNEDGSLQAEEIAVMGTREKSTPGFGDLKVHPGG